MVLSQKYPSSALYELIQVELFCYLRKQTNRARQLLEIISLNTTQLRFCVQDVSNEQAEPSYHKPKFLIIEKSPTTSILNEQTRPEEL